MAQLKLFLSGDKELIKTMEALSASCSKKIMEPAIKEGLKDVQKEAKDLAKPGNILSEKATGLMRKAVKIMVKISRNGMKIMGKVFVDRKTKSTIDGKLHIPGMIAHLVEFGHGGPAPAPAHPFMRPALDNKKKQALSSIINKAKQLLPIIVKNARQKGKGIFK